MKNSSHTALLLASLALLLAGHGVFARPHGDADRPRGDSAERSGGVRISLDQAVAMAERRFSAKVVRAETSERDGRTIYVLRLLNDAGRVWTVQVDATSGSIG